MMGLLEGALLSAVLIALAVRIALALVVPRLHAPGTGRDGRVNPTGAVPTSEWSARAWLYAPIWLPMLLLLTALAMDPVSALLLGGDHCLLHEGGHHHHHLCLIHPPHASGNVLGWALPLALATPAALMLGFCAARTRTQWRLTRTLVSVSRPSEWGADVRLLDTAEPMAVTVGWWRPVVLLSAGLVDGLSPASLAVVIAHERAHVARRDTLRASLDRFASALVSGRVARALGARIVLAREQACDAAAAAAIGDRNAVARALVDVVRLGVTSPPAFVSVASGQLEARILQLRAPAPARAGRWHLYTFGLAIAAAVVVGAAPIHAGLEHLVTFILH